MEADIERAQTDGKTKAQKKMKLMMVMNRWLESPGGFRAPKL